MDRQPPSMSPHDAKARRARAVRTALVLGGIAAAIYVAFILSGVLGQ
jgi:hypothetical protein